MIRNVLAFETSCDDTSVAVVRPDGTVAAIVSAHQNQVHEIFGGIVPELASRNHTHQLLPLTELCLQKAGLRLEDIDAFAVTSCPGLIGSLMVGLVTVKSLSLATGKPFIGVNHLEGHLLAPFLRDAECAPPERFDYPYVALAISGGHTSLYRVEDLGNYEVLGQTVDDAAGEAFDKFGKMIGLGFPGGVRVDLLSRNGRADAFQFPRAMLKDVHLNFSFSGLKSSASRTLAELADSERAILDDDLAAFLTSSSANLANLGRPGLLADLCASFQEAIVDVLLDRLSRAVKSEGVSRAVLTGGVSANSRLRFRTQQWAKATGIELVIPPIRYCTDNAAMIGLAGIARLNRGERSSQSLGPAAKAPLGQNRDRR